MTVYFKRVRMSPALKLKSRATTMKGMFYAGFFRDKICVTQKHLFTVYVEFETEMSSEKKEKRVMLTCMGEG